ncbi:hypothetical protein J6590_012468 [Homalodisca vitripennis]|nr:hypothetical protein J6590_012468 [Homalodisca vitripennis]
MKSANRKQHGAPDAKLLPPTMTISRAKTSQFARQTVNSGGVRVSSVPFRRLSRDPNMDHLHPQRPVHVLCDFVRLGSGPLCPTDTGPHYDLR